MSSAAARNCRIAVSPGVRVEPLFVSAGRSLPNMGKPLASSPTPTVAAPAASNPFFINERRLAVVFRFLSRSFTLSLLEVVARGEGWEAGARQVFYRVPASIAG